MLQLTAQAHLAVDRQLQPGDTAVDATAGNGHDTVFLSRRVGIRGKVYAFDIQNQALQNTSKRIHQLALDNVVLIEADHAQMQSHLPVDCHGQIAVVMFNLGYLPGGDKRLTTRPASTVQAMQAARSILKCDGLMSIIVYPGHAGGSAELDAVSEYCDQLPPRSVQRQLCDSESPNDKTKPHLFLVRNHR